MMWCVKFISIRFLHLDLLQGEGVAYRGRVLVELSTELDGKIDKNVDNISSDDILVAQVYAALCDPVITAVCGLFMLRFWAYIKIYNFSFIV